MHHVYSDTLLNYNQFCFTPKKSAICAALGVKGYVEEGMSQGHTATPVSLDVKGAFDAAWWPSILNTDVWLTVHRNSVWIRKTN